MNTTTTTEQTADASQNCEQIRIDPKYRLELVASKPNGGRPALEVIRVCNSKRFGNCAVATQGRSMAIVPIEGDCVKDERAVHPYNVSVEALKASRKVAKAKSDLNGMMSLNGDIKIGDGTTLPLPDQETNYPNWEMVLPRLDSDKTSKGGFKFTVALNAQLLLDLAKAIGSDGAVTLRFIDELSPITVTSNFNGNGELGVLMPMRVGG